MKRLIKKIFKISASTLIGLFVFGLVLSFLGYGEEEDNKAEPTTKIELTKDATKDAAAPTTKAPSNNKATNKPAATKNPKTTKVNNSNKPYETKKVTETIKPSVTPTTKAPVASIKPTVAPTKAPQKADTASSEVKIIFIDCGNGDAILVESGTQSLLIDAGDKLGATAKALRENNVESLNYIVNTHPHADHIRDFENVINGFTDKNTVVYGPNATANTKLFESYLTALSENGLKIKRASVGTTFYVGSAKCTIIGPSSDSYSELNDYSVSILLEANGKTVLLCGDAEGVAEKEIVKTGYLDKKTIDIYKACHHGSWQDACNSTFLNSFTPARVVIPCASENKYNHPHFELLEWLINAKCDTWITGYQGNIEFTISADGTITSNVSPYGIDKLKALATSKKNTYDSETKAPVATVTPTPTKKSDAKWLVNTNSGKFHKIDGCSGAKNMAEHNKKYIDDLTYDDMVDAGYSPCGTCFR